MKGVLGRNDEVVRDSRGDLCARRTRVDPRERFLGSVPVVELPLSVVRWPNADLVR